MRINISMSAGRFAVGDRIAAEFDRTKDDWAVGTVLKTAPTKYKIQFDYGETMVLNDTDCIFIKVETGNKLFKKSIKRVLVEELAGKTPESLKHAVFKKKALNLVNAWAEKNGFEQREVPRGALPSWILTSVDEAMKISVYYQPEGVKAYAYSADPAEVDFGSVVLKYSDQLIPRLEKFVAEAIKQRDKKVGKPISREERLKREETKRLAEEQRQAALQEKPIANPVSEPEPAADEQAAPATKIKIVKHGTKAPKLNLPVPAPKVAPKPPRAPRAKIVIKKPLTTEQRTLRQVAAALKLPGGDGVTLTDEMYQWRKRGGQPIEVNRLLEYLDKYHELQFRKSNAPGHMPRTAKGVQHVFENSGYILSTYARPAGEEEARFSIVLRKK